jgi:plasmid maintenance system antidote protein VapI
MNDSEIIITVERVAEILGVSRKTIYNNIEGQITYEKLMAYIQDQISKSQSNTQRWVDAQDTIYQIHRTFVGEGYMG